MSKGTRYALAVVALLVAMAVTVAASAFMTGRAVGQSDHRWCDTLNLLTSKPVAKPADPAQNQSREGEYQLYIDFVMLRRNFGC